MEKASSSAAPAPAHRRTPRTGFIESVMKDVMPGVYLAAALGGAAVSHHEAAPHETRIFEAERQMPKVSGFGEFMGVPDRSVERFLAILPPGLLANEYRSEFALVLLTEVEVAEGAF